MALAPPPPQWTDWMVSFMDDALRGGNATAPERGRAPCSAEERALGDSLAATWTGWGYDVSREAFACAPHAFLGVLPLAVLAYVRALRLYERNPVGGFLAIFLGAALFVAEIIRYKEVIEYAGVFPTATGAAADTRTAGCGGVWDFGRRACAGEGMVRRAR